MVVGDNASIVQSRSTGLFQLEAQIGEVIMLGGGIITRPTLQLNI